MGGREISEGGELFFTWPIGGVFSQSIISLSMKEKKPHEGRLINIGPNVSAMIASQGGIFEKGCSIQVKKDMYMLGQRLSESSVVIPFWMRF